MRVEVSGVAEVCDELWRRGHIQIGASDAERSGDRRWRSLPGDTVRSGDHDPDGMLNDGRHREQTTALNGAIRGRALAPHHPTRGISRLIDVPHAERLTGHPAAGPKDRNTPTRPAPTIPRRPARNNAR